MDVVCLLSGACRICWRSPETLTTRRDATTERGLGDVSEPAAAAAAAAAAAPATTIHQRV